jgi:hypothetical protein
MARIPPEELERLKAEISVERLVESSGVERQGLTRSLPVPQGPGGFAGRDAWEEPVALL